MSGNKGCSRILSIDEIYSKVEDYDLVITNDIALCTALNRRVDRTSLGTFCMTPRQIALRFFPSSYGRRPDVSSNTFPTESERSRSGRYPWMRSAVGSRPLQGKVFHRRNHNIALKTLDL